MLLELVVAALESIDARYAVIGGLAVAMRGHPRLTIDYDFLIGALPADAQESWQRIVTASR
ncbi:MAG TPA: hypothetical protein VGF48_17250 [Thermoanaerobaculia bacterium]|jgi:hypothetical protein